nr:PD-(D/E)XK nuclease family protein [Nocardia arthritidis]
MSVSQYKTYQKCPRAWYLEKVEKAWQRPAAWLAQGTAVHAAAEAYERSGRTLPVEDMKETYRQSYADEIAKYTKDTPNFTHWFGSGPYRGAQDIERRFLIGLEQTEKYQAWYEAHPHEVVWVSEDGTPGIEMEFDLDLDGVMIKGYIDAVMRNVKQDYLFVRDNKTGNTPGDLFQLGTYKVAVEDAYGVEVSEGDYWMGRTGKPTIAQDLSDWTKERVAEEFHALADNIQSERFDPDPEPSKCRFCSVSMSCEFSL